MSNKDLVNALINALGRNDFNPDQVIQALHEKIQEMQAQGQNPGSLIAVANILPEITAEAKKRY